MSEEFEGFVPPTKNYFPMPNEWINISAKITNLAELKVIEYVLRHTWGYQEYGITKTISVDEFCHGRRRQDRTRMDNGTGLSEPSVKAGLKRAIKHGYLVCEVDDKDQGRVKKSYALKNKEGGKKVTPQESYPVGILPPGDKEVTPREQESYPRSEKDTLERHLEKDTKVRMTSTSILDVDAHAPEPSLEKTVETLIDVQADLARLQAQLPPQERIDTHDVDTPLPVAAHGDSTALQVHGRLPDSDWGTDPSEKGTNDDGQLTQTLSTPSLQRGGAARTTSPRGEPRAPEAGKQARDRKATPQDMPPEVVRILDDWDSLHKKPFPRTEKHVQAAFLLITDNPTKEDLHECEKWHYTTDRPEKPWYRIHGVRLQDIAENIGRWRALQDAPALPAKRGRESPEDFTSKTLDKERNDRRIQEMIEQSKKIRAEREAAQAATK